VVVASGWECGGRLGTVTNRLNTYLGCLLRDSRFGEGQVTNPEQLIAALTPVLHDGLSTS